MFLLILSRGEVSQAGHDQSLGSLQPPLPGRATSPEQRWGGAAQRLRSGEAAGRGRNASEVVQEGWKSMTYLKTQCFRNDE